MLDRRIFFLCRSFLTVQARILKDIFQKTKLIEIKAGVCLCWAIEYHNILKRSDRTKISTKNETLPHLQ